MALKTSCLGWREPEEGGREVSRGQSCSQSGGSWGCGSPGSPKGARMEHCHTCCHHHLRCHLCSIRPGSRPWVPRAHGGRGAALWGYTGTVQPQPLGRCCKGQLWHLRADWIKDLECNPRLLQSTHLSWEALGFHPWHSDGPGAQSPAQEQPPLQQGEHEDLCRANAQSPNTPNQEEHIPS